MLKRGFATLAEQLRTEQAAVRNIIKKVISVKKWDIKEFDEQRVIAVKYCERCNMGDLKGFRIFQPRGVFACLDCSIGGDIFALRALCNEKDIGCANDEQLLKDADAASAHPIIPQRFVTKERTRRQPQKIFQPSFPRMTNDEVMERLHHLGFTVKEQGNTSWGVQLILKDCPFCHTIKNATDQYKCGISIDKQMYNCFRCQSKGSLQNFFKSLPI